MGSQFLHSTPVSTLKVPSLNKKMTILAKAVYRGPHLHSRTPMVRIELDLGVLENWPTNKIDGFKDRLLGLLPDLQEHGCSYGAPGGFVKRLEEGTWLGHVIEHIALELQAKAGIDVTRGKTRSIKGMPGHYNVMFAYEEERVGLYAGRLAIELVNSILPLDLAGIKGLEILGCENWDGFTTVEAAVASLKKMAGRDRLGPTTRSIVEAAKRQGIPTIRLDDQSMVQLGWGKKQRRIRASITDATSQIAVDAAGNKELTKKLLDTVGVPVPKGMVVRTADDAVRAAERIGYPVTIKPLNGNHGRGVTTNIGTETLARKAFELASEHSRNVLIEQHFNGRDYRVLLVDYKVVAVAERVPAHVIGNGRDSISKLIEAVNADPRRGGGHEEALSKIAIDDALKAKLERSQLSLDTVPENGQKIWLRDTANLSTGGTAIDRTDEIHPSNILLMERAARAIGLDIAGIL